MNTKVCYLAYIDGVYHTRMIATFLNTNARMVHTMAETLVEVSDDDLGVHLYLNRFCHFLYYCCVSFASSIVLYARKYCNMICILLIYSGIFLAYCPMVFLGLRVSTEIMCLCCMLWYPLRFGLPPL